MMLRYALVFVAIANSGLGNEIDRIICSYQGLDPKEDFVPFFEVSNTTASFTLAGDVRFDLLRPSEWAAMAEIGIMRGTANNFDSFSFARVRAPTKGTLRTPHYDAHRAELVYVVKGKARATVTGTPNSKRRGKGERLRGRLRKRNLYIAPEVARETDTFVMTSGDAFFAPPGYTHSYSNVADDGEDLLALSIYDAGSLSSHDLPQLFKGFPDQLLAKSLNVPVEDVKGWYDGPRRVYIQAKVPPDLSDATDKDSKYYIEGFDQDLKQAPRSDQLGVVKTSILDADSYGELELAKFSFAVTEIAPGALMDPFWVDNGDELIFVLEGSNLVVTRSGKQSQSDCVDTFSVHGGYLLLHEETVTMSIENKGEETAKIFRIFNTIRPTFTTLHDAFQGLPDDVVQTMLG